MKKLLSVMWAILVAGSAAFMWAGCDGGEEPLNKDQLFISPASSIIDNSTQVSVTLRAGDTPEFSETTFSTNLFLPLEWTVSDEALGRIEASQGDTAIYISSGQTNRGNNIVTCRDRSAKEGVAVVTAE